MVRSPRSATPLDGSNNSRSFSNYSNRVRKNRYRSKNHRKSDDYHPSQNFDDSRNYTSVNNHENSDGFRNYASVNNYDNSRNYSSDCHTRDFQSRLPMFLNAISHLPFEFRQKALAEFNQAEAEFFLNLATAAQMEMVAEENEKKETEERVRREENEKKERMEHAEEMEEKPMEVEKVLAFRHKSF